VGQIVRIKSDVSKRRSIYHGDLARITEYDDINGRVTIKLIPRLEDDSEQTNDEAKEKNPLKNYRQALASSSFIEFREKQKKDVRAPQRFFDPQKVSSSFSLSFN